MSKPKDVYGRVNFSWAGNVILPIEEAHKVQAILARYAIGFSEAYRSDMPNVKYMVDYSVPDVSITELPKYDCTGMTNAQRNDWEQSVRDSADESFLSPQEFLALRGE